MLTASALSRSSAVHPPGQLLFCLLSKACFLRKKRSDYRHLSDVFSVPRFWSVGRNNPHQHIFFKWRVVVFCTRKRWFSSCFSIYSPVPWNYRWIHTIKDACFFSHGPTFTPGEGFAYGEIQLVTFSLNNTQQTSIESTWYQSVSMRLLGNEADLKSINLDASPRILNWGDAIRGK